jgi:hypothetical protein
MKAKLPVAAVLCAVCLIGLAIAQQANVPADKPPFGPPHPPGPVMAALDANKDGMLSADEIAGAIAALLTLDKNGDGMLTEDELRPAPPSDGQAPDPGARIMKLDTDGDGYVTFAEFVAPAREIFDKIDTSKDGKIDKTEAAAAPPPPPHGPGCPGGPPPQGAGKGTNAGSTQKVTGSAGNSAKKTK